MKKFYSATINNALLEATNYFKCPLNDLEYEILQYPSRGIFGINKKDAIIIVSQKLHIFNAQPKDKEIPQENEHAIKQSNQTQSQQIIQNDANGAKKNINIENLSNSTTKDLQYSQHLIKEVQSILNEDQSNSKEMLTKPDDSICLDSNFIESSRSKQVSLDKEKPREIQVKENTSPIVSLKNMAKERILQENIDQNRSAIEEIDKNIASKKYMNQCNQKVESKIFKLSTEKTSYTSTNSNFSSQYCNRKKDFNPLSTKDIENIPTAILEKKIYADIDSSLYINKELSSEKENIKNVDDVCRIIKNDLQDMLKSMNLDVEVVEVSECDKATLYIFVDGGDCALLIGKKGYRYKALGYLLFNWINPMYGYNVKLEIAEFLKNQEKMMKKYLQPIIDEIKEKGKSQTRPLDGALLNIALRILRNEFPDKYISYRSTTDDLKYIIIDNFLTQKDNLWT